MICEENGQIIVDELRPMSDAPKDGTTFLAKHILESALEATYYESGFYETTQYTSLQDDQFIGWIPMPIYRPKDGK